MIPGLTFDEEAHRYFFEGKPVPGVTSILQPVSGLHMVPRDILDAAANFGKAVHKACELWDLGTLDEDALDEKLVPYLDAWKMFSSDNEVQWTMVEGQVFHQSHRYAGTLDRFGKVKKRDAVVDIKSSAKLYASVGPQLAAYKNAIPRCPPVCDRIGVQLKPDGKYVAEVYSDPSDWPFFLSLLTTRNWCARHSITPFYPQ